jgi:hypothetical protein
LGKEHADRNAVFQALRASKGEGAVMAGHIAEFAVSAVVSRAIAQWLPFYNKPATT